MNRLGLRVARYRFRATFSRRWGGYLAVVLLIGLLGGIAMGTVAAGRRTQSAFTAFSASIKSTDLGLTQQPNNNGYYPSLTSEIGRLPQVTRAETVVGLSGAILRPDGTIATPLAGGQFSLAGSVDGELFNLDRFSITRGRMANPARADEAVVDQFAAKGLGLHLGQVLSLGISTSAGTDFHFRRATVKIVGIGLDGSEVVRDDVDRHSGYILATPAMTRSVLDCCVTTTLTGAQLHGGSADVPAVEREFIAALPKEVVSQFQVGALVEAQAERAIKPEAIALGVFGATAAIATLLIAGQSIARQLRRGREDLDVLRALGADPVMTATDGLVGIAGSVVVGSLLAVGLAVGLSPLAPIGPVRKVFHPGIAADWTVLAVGLVALIGGLGALALALAYREAPHRVAQRATVTAERRSGLVHAAAASGLPAPAVAGIRFALETGRGRSSVPVRSAMTGTALAVVTVVATLTFGSGLRTLVSHPALYGWNWNYALEANNGYNSIPYQQAQALLDHDPDVAAWSGVLFFSVQLDGRVVPTLVSAHTALTPPILSGHAPAAGDQIAVGAATLAQLHKRVGDTVIGSFGNPNSALYLPPTQLRIVGTATMPAVGIAGGLHTSMGTGALAIATGPPSSNPLDGPNMIFVRFRHGADPSRALGSLQRITSSINQVLAASPDFAGTGVDVALLSVQRPAEIVNYRSMGTTPAILASGLAAGAVIGLGLTLTASVRRRRRDLALLKTFGFTQWQLAATVAWQASVAAVIGIVVGMPLGVTLGRWLWIMFARQIHAVPRPTVPALSLVLVAVGGLVLANVVAALPGRVAARTATALVLRTE